MTILVGRTPTGQSFGNKDIFCDICEVPLIKIYFGTKYSEKLGAYVQNDKDEKVLVHMGSYGIGISRLVGSIPPVSECAHPNFIESGITPTPLFGKTFSQFCLV